MTILKCGAYLTVSASNFSVSSDLFLIAFTSVHEASQIQFRNVIPKGNLIN